MFLTASAHRAGEVCIVVGVGQNDDAHLGTCIAQQRARLHAATGCTEVKQHDVSAGTPDEVDREAAVGRRLAVPAGRMVY